MLVLVLVGVLLYPAAVCATLIRFPQPPEFEASIQTPYLCATTFYAMCLFFCQFSCIISMSASNIPLVFLYGEMISRSSWLLVSANRAATFCKYTAVYLILNPCISLSVDC